MEATYKTYRPAWRSYYKHIAAIFLIFIAACVFSFIGLKNYKTILWIAALILIVALFIHMAAKRISVSLILRDDPEKPQNQEVAFESGILKHESIEIGLVNIMHIVVTQTIMQRIFNIGDIQIASSGTETNEIVIKDMPAPKDIRDEIQTHSRKYTMQTSETIK